MIEEKAGKIKLLILDVDGVLTDGQIIINDHGEEIKFFDVKDGLGLKMLMSDRVVVALVTGRKSLVVKHRAEDLGIKEVHQGVADKKAICRQLIKNAGLNKEEVCCMGDDLPDLAMFAEAGLRIAVADGVGEIREAADIITRNKGGHGAVREVCELLIKCRKDGRPR